MRIQIISRKLIQPSSPTPPHLQTMKVSAMDQLASPVYVATIFYYPNGGKDISEMRNKLEKSLSEILTIFYPMAGRYNNNSLVLDCNDHGAEYFEARVNGQLSQILNGEMQPEELNDFVPFPVESPTIAPLMLVQVNMFDCGGLAIGLRITHRLADGFTITSFMDGWARACRLGVKELRLYPDFSLGSFFPARENHGIMNKLLPSASNGAKLVTRNIVFSRTAISNLKSILKTNGDDGANLNLKHKPSRVDVVTALLWRSLIKAAKAKYGYLRPSLMIHAVDMRGKTTLPIPANSCGNFFRLAGAWFRPNDNNDMAELNHLVGLIGDAVRKAVMECSKSTNYIDLFQQVSDSFKVLDEEMNKGEMEVHMFSSWCRFPVYEADFGWGKPAWVSGVHKPMKIVHMMDTKDDGIEVWLSLDEKDSIFLQQDPEITAFIDS